MEYSAVEPQIEAFFAGCKIKEMTLYVWGDGKTTDPTQRPDTPSKLFSSVGTGQFLALNCLQLQYKEVASKVKAFFEQCKKANMTIYIAAALPTPRIESMVRAVQTGKVLSVDCGELGVEGSRDEIRDFIVNCKKDAMKLYVSAVKDDESDWSERPDTPAEQMIQAITAGEVLEVYCGKLTDGEIAAQIESFITECKARRMRLYISDSEEAVRGGL